MPPSHRREESVDGDLRPRAPSRCTVAGCLGLTGGVQGQGTASRSPPGFLLPMYHCTVRSWFV